MISDHDKLGSAAKQNGAIACDQQAEKLIARDQAEQHKSNL